MCADIESIVGANSIRPPRSGSNSLFSSTLCPAGIRFHGMRSIITTEETLIPPNDHLADSALPPPPRPSLPRPRPPPRHLSEFPIVGLLQINVIPVCCRCNYRFRIRGHEKSLSSPPSITNDRLDVKGLDTKTIALGHVPRTPIDTVLGIIGFAEFDAAPCSSLLSILCGEGNARLYRRCSAVSFSFVQVFPPKRTN